MAWPSVDELVTGRRQRSYLKHRRWWVEYTLAAFAFLERLGFTLDAAEDAGIDCYAKGTSISFQGPRSAVIVQYSPESNDIYADLWTGDWNLSLDDALRELEPETTLPVGKPLDRAAVEARVRWWAEGLERYAQRLLLDEYEPPIDVDVIARDYFAPWELEGGDDDPNFRRSSDAASRIERIVRHSPDRGWTLLLALVERAPSEDGLGLLAAGPIEDFVREHGLTFLDRIDQAAEQNESLRRALSQTYGWDTMPDAVVDRLMRHFPQRDREYWLERRRQPDAADGSARP